MNTNHAEIEPTDEPTDADKQDVFEAAGGTVAGHTQRGELLSRLVLVERSARSYFVWDEGTESYTGPFASTLVPRVFDLQCPILRETTITGRGVLGYGKQGGLRDCATLLGMAGRVLEDVVFVVGLEKAEYDENSNQLRACAAPWRKGLEPRHDPEVAEWLRLLCGDQYELMCDWLSTFQRVDLPTCAPYIEAIKGAGKGMIANGLARLYASSEVVLYEHATGEFNDRLLKSSLIVADEKMADQGGRRGAPSAIFRKMVGDSSFLINGKGKAAIPLRGCVRLIITANDDLALNLVNEQLSKDSVDAITERILYVVAHDRGAAARQYLVDSGSWRKTREWVAGDRIARHVLWLEQSRGARVAHNAGRFLVAGTSDATRLVVNKEQSRVLEALATYLDRYHETKARIVEQPGNRMTGIAPVRNLEIVPGGGSLKVRGEALAKIWPSLVPDDKFPPSKNTAGRWLANLPGVKLGKMWVGTESEQRRKDCWDIPAALLIEEASRLGIGGDSGEGSKSDIEKLLHQEVQPEDDRKTA